jgi:hypothetical protein
MTGPLSEYAGTFLLVVGLGALVLLGLPLLFRPVLWATALRWSQSGQGDLTVYFGRSLGAVVCVLSVFAVIAAGDPLVQPFFYQITLASFALTAAVHVWGALRGIQPATETAETVVWLGLLGLGLLCYPGSGPAR